MMTGLPGSVLMRLRYLIPAMMAMPPRLRAADERPKPLFPGNAEAGKHILSGIWDVAGQQRPRQDASPWYAPDAGREWLAALHGFGWLGDMAQFSATKGAAACARTLVEDWLSRTEHHHAVAFQPDVRGARLAHWALHARLVLADAPAAFRRRFFAAMLREFTVLSTLLARPSPETGFMSVYGVAVASFSLPLAAWALPQALSALHVLCERDVMEDGLVRSRSPSLQLHDLETLIAIREILKRAEQPVPITLDETIRRMASCLAYMRHGDGGLALFNDSVREEPSRIGALLEMAGAPPPATGGVRGVSGFIRLERGNTVVLMDAGWPEPANPHQFAGTLGIELSDGRERVIVNCGAYRGGNTMWQRASRSRAAHSTLTVERIGGETVSPSPVRSETEIALVEPATTTYRPRVHVLTGEEGDHLFAEAVCERYAGMDGMVFNRQLYLAAGGRTLVGTDILSRHQADAVPMRLYMRFHLHPDVTPMALPDGGIGLYLPSGSEWRFYAARPEVTALEESVYLGQDGQPHPSSQIVIGVSLPKQEDVLEWTITKLR